MPFCEFWRAEHAGVSVFDVLEVSIGILCGLLISTFGLGEVLRFRRQLGEEAIERVRFGGRILGNR